jgi:two-component system KDP operon response regulator KdpE
VLVVDDDHAIRRFLGIALRARDYSVFEAGSAREAVAAVSTIRPDVVILDLGLPDGDGIEVTRRLRGSERFPILILSVQDQEEEKVAALEAGADDYLTKHVRDRRAPCPAPSPPSADSGKRVRRPV